MKIGDIVIIKECHKIPEVVGKQAVVIDIHEMTPESKYNILVYLFEEMEMLIDTPVGQLKHPTKGPFPFREEELKLKEPPPELPKAFQEMDKG